MVEYSIPQKIRSSNIELMRIVLMLAIIAHHYVVNSSVMDGITLDSLTPNIVGSSGIRVG